MEWIYPRRRSKGTVEYLKQNVSDSTPPIQLITIFAIVILLLCFSNYTSHKAHLDHSALNFHFLIVFLPILLIISIAAYFSNWMHLYSGLQHQSSRVRPATGSGSGSFPFGIAIFVVLLLVLLSYHSSFHSKWFGSL